MSAECVFEESVVAVEAVVAVDVEDLEAVFLAVVVDFLVIAFFFLVDFLAGRLLISDVVTLSAHVSLARQPVVHVSTRATIMNTFFIFVDTFLMFSS